ncbi:MAG: transcription termination/antitermination factor NusG [Erysipelotrichaceae bacterium]|nr:transcription termination/antitermination factor NusG [Erysipelotrichaceae bacterium]MBQ1315351.1 transcription termination/antitermination factor NusG [Erysipelotrichaceae bacterium]
MDEKKTEEKRQWYVVNTYAGHENRVKENLERRIKTMGMEENLFQVVVAEETEIDYKEKNGKPVKVTKTRNMFPGYIFVDMIMSDDAWYQIRNTPGVTGFIGSSGGGAKPLPVHDDEMINILHKLELTDEKLVVNFKVGDRVRILSGPFANVEGVVESMNDETEVATVLTIMFSQETPTDVSYIDLEKLD